MLQLALQERTHLLEREYNLVTARAATTESAVTNALDQFPASAAPFNAFPAQNGLADQLKLVARMIAARDALGTKRQVFFVSLGGFDLHDNLITSQARLMGNLSSALDRFPCCHRVTWRGRQGDRVHRLRLRPHPAKQW